jgi:hypothetical protein
MTSYIRAYSLGKRLSRAHFMEKHAKNLAQQNKEHRQLQKTKIAELGSEMNWKERARGALNLTGRGGLSNKRTVDRGLAMPSMQERYDSARDLPTSSLEKMVPALEIEQDLGIQRMPKEGYKILQDELSKRRHGGVGSYSRDLSTVQRDVDKVQADVRNAYTPKLPQFPAHSQKQDQPPNQAPNFMSDRTPRKYQVGDLSEGLTFGRRPVNVIRPDTLKVQEKQPTTEKELMEMSRAYAKPSPSSPGGPFTQTREPYVYPEYNYQSGGPRFAPNRAAYFDRDTYNKKTVYEDGQQVNPSAYVLNASADPRNPGVGYTNPIIAAHEYGHGEYDMDEVEADALAATTDYGMYDLADFYNNLTDHGKYDYQVDTDTYADHEARGDTHLPVAERTQLMADNVNPYK